VAADDAEPRIASIYRRLPPSAGLGIGVSPEQQHDALLGYYRSLREQLADCPVRPLISIVVPTYCPDEHFFGEMLGSIALQIYPDWELCIVDDASDDPSVMAAIETFAAAHPGKVRAARRATNGHIAQASNDALAMATGQYVALLDHDDRLYPNALAEVVLAINAAVTPDGRLPQVLYTDERMIDEDGRPLGEVWLKPDWMPLLHLTSNYTNHLTVYDRALLERLGGFRSGFDGSQDHDLMLRATEATEADGQSVLHVPALTYQWRSHGGSVAKNPGVKSYSVERAITAVSQACERRGTPARVWREPGEIPNRIDFDLPDPLPTVAVLLLDRGGDRDRCQRSLMTGYPNLSVMSPGQDGPRTVLEAVATTNAPYLAVIADDLDSIRGDWASAMLSLVHQPGIGAVTGLVLDSDDRIISSGLVGLGSEGVQGAMAGARFSPYLYLAWANSIHEVFAASTDAMMLDVAEIRSCLSAEPDLGQQRRVDVDLSLALRSRGQRVVFTPYARFVAQSPRRWHRRPTPAERAALVRRWGAELAADPYLNPGLARSAGFRVDPHVWVPEVPPELFRDWLAAGRVD